MSPVLTTDSVPADNRLAYWRDAMGRTQVPTAVSPRHDGPFDGRIATHRVGFLRVSTVDADAHRTSRTSTHIKRSSEDFVVLGVQMSGTATLAQDGRQASAGPGDLMVYDTTRPYVLDYPERFSTRVVQMPRRALGLPDEDLRRITGTAVGTTKGCGAVLMPFLATLVASADSYSPAAAGGLASTVVDLFGTLVAEQAENAPVRPENSRGHLVLRIRDHIDRNLGDPALSPESIAKAHHISVRYLHRLFEDEGITVGRLMQRRRLEECARELSRGGRVAPTVSSVAQRWGFVNPAHFSRVFRTVYGISPREWRSLRGGESTAAGKPLAVPKAGPKNTPPTSPTTPPTAAPRPCSVSGVGC
ncbi:helix-turn-helix domain-containing protein [Streptomyces sp. NPDC058620]|uniref:AraC-like ligand-binding domain-containing protein n=1 Tax=Streptomyces sp. NPDC058620 TaxID=3346560 RepID=UPI003657014F